MLQLVVIAIAGAMGALSRYWITSAVLSFEHVRFPVATLAINVVGSFLMGIAYVIIVERLQLAPEWRALFMTGFLGAFTTFSTFSLETVTLLQEGNGWTALLYVVASIALGVIGLWAGFLLAR